MTPNDKETFELFIKQIGDMQTQQPPDMRKVLAKVMNQSLAVPPMNGDLFGIPRYDRGGAVLLAYLEDKQATGLIESVSADLPPNVKVQIRLCAGAYRGVIEPWLEEFVHPNTVYCKVVVCRLEGMSLGIDFTREELREVSPDFRVRARMEVTPYFKGGGRFEYGGPDYK